MPEGWSRQAADYVDSTAVCPRCGARIEPTLVCGTCRAILSGEEAVRVRAASQQAAAALRERQRLIDLLPLAPVAGAAPIPAPATAVPPPSAVVPRAPRAQGQIGVPSVLAVVGAALVAVAGIVFTFLNPDVAFAARTVIIGLLTVLFLGASWLMMRRRLRLSAEALGALGMVFVVLDIWAAVQKTPLDVSGWVPAAVGTLLASVVMLVLAVLVRMRVWLWTSVVGFALVPAMFGYALTNGWAVHAGHVAAGFVAWGAHRLLRRVAGRFGSELRADHGTATTLQLLASGIVVLTLPFFPGPTGLAVLDAGVDDAGARVVGAGLLLLALALLAVLGTRDGLARLWSVLSGLWVGLAILQLAFVPLDDAAPRILLAALTTAVVLVLLAAIPLPGTMRRRQVLAGATVVAGLGAVPAAFASLLELGSAGALMPADPGRWTTLGLTAAAAGAAAAGFLLRRRDDGAAARAVWIASLWIGADTLLTLAAWTGWTRATGALIALAAALVLGLLVLLVPAARRSPAWLRIPVLVAAHALLLVAGISSWIERPLTVPVGVAIVAVLIPLGLASPRALRPYTVAVGYAYALVVFATGLARADVESIAVLCLTASLAAVAGLAATLVRRVRAAVWYAVLVVTAVPFLIGVVTVLFVRSGWTALSTGLILLLALTLLLTRRPGLTRFVRTLAAALLVPALAVVVVCLGAQLLVQSASPVTLPIIAVIVAATLCATTPIATGLTRHGLAAPDARAARIAIEASALVTGAIAVLLALVREAAGLGTTFVVLLVLGIGAAAAAAFAKRGYGWWVAGVCWSGALWCALWLAGVQVVEPYVLPPALALTVVGVLLAARGGAGLPLVATGLACAVLPTLVLLAVTGPGGGILPWRTVGLLGGALVLLALSRLAAGGVDRHSRLAGLHVPVLVAAIVASAAGAVQGVRWAARADGLAVPSAQLILPVLGLAVVAVVLAGLGGRMLAQRTGRVSRWVLAPATLYLIIGPITSARDAWLPIWTLWGLMLALLAAVVLVAWRARRGESILPPVWLLWGAAWTVAVAGWSARELRVEMFSLPLGIALVAAGVVGMRPVPAAASDRPARRTPNGWPTGFTGSWALLAPGIAAVFLPSLLSTGTDPQTWRAILVIALALAAILVGSLFKLGAPFVLGIAVLPIENIVVFAVQIGRSIGSTPWWITLASAGAVLIVIAATWERRTGGERGVAARMRDLR
jgi:hypothetical protein